MLASYRIALLSPGTFGKPHIMPDKDGWIVFYDGWRRIKCTNSRDEAYAFAAEVYPGPMPV